MKNRNCTVFALALLALAVATATTDAQSTYEPYTFTTLAGGGGFRSADGTGSAERFWIPSGVGVDSSGNVYVGDQFNTVIRKVTPAGVVTTLAGLAGSFGSADGTGSTALFNAPFGVAVDSAGNVYVADGGNHTIRKVTPEGAVTTLAGLAGGSGSADGTGSDAQFGAGNIGGPLFVAVDSAGNVYVGDNGNHTIRKVTPEGEVTTLAGLAGSSGSADGTGSDARFSQPRGVAVDTNGNVYVADTDNSTIRKVTPAGVVTTLAGLAGSDGSSDGTGGVARFNGPNGVAVDSAGNVYVADTSNFTVRKVTPAGVVTTLAGVAGSPGSADGTRSAARFDSPFAVAVDSGGYVYVAESRNNTIRKVTPAGVVTTLAGLGGLYGSADGTGSAALFRGPSSVAVDSAGDTYVADQVNHTIRKVTSGGVVTTLAGRAGNPGSADGTGGTARFSAPLSVAVDSGGNVYVAETLRNTIRKVTSAGVVTTLVTLADSFFLSGVTVDTTGNLYVVDNFKNTIRKVTAEGVVTTLAGLEYSSGSADGTGSNSRFNFPYGVAVDSTGNLYVADLSNHTIRKVTAEGVVTTLAGRAGYAGSADGTGSAARFWSPFGVAVDSGGNVYVADTFNNAVRKVSPAGVVTTLAGITGTFGSADGTGSQARFNSPNGVAVDNAGNLYVADYYLSTIRKGYPALTISNAGFSGGQLGFNLTGPTGQSVILEASTDLVTWLPLLTNTFAGALHFSDPQSRASSHRFYRAHRL